MLAIIKKELKNYFFSPIGYVVIGIFLIAFSIFFVLTTIQNISIDLTYLFYYTALYGLMFITPLLTMWLISGEKKTGTDQLIMTSPISMVGMVIAKFIASLILVIVPTILTFIYYLLLCHYEVPDLATFIVSMLGFILLAMTYLAFGTFASSLTESPIIAGIMSFAFVFASTWLPYLISALSGFSLIDMFVNFLYAQIDIISLVVFVTLTVLCLVLTVIVLQRRKSVK